VSTKSILIIAYSDLKSDPRVKRQIEALKDTFTISTLAYSPADDNSVLFEQIYIRPSFSIVRKIKRFVQLLSGMFDLFYWDDGKNELSKRLRKKKIEMVIANDIHTLPLALSIAGNSGKVYFDAHEYHPGEWEDNFKWNLLYKKYTGYLCRKYIPRADAFSTVCESIAEEYRTFTGVRPFIITNATEYEELAPSLTDDRKIKIIHHGASIPSRKIEGMIDVMNFLDERFTLDMMLTELDKHYLASLKKLAERNPRINFVPAVKQNEICKRINNYDIGLFLLPPVNLNYLHALPNKIFDFVQARLCIAVSPSPEMANLVGKYDLGVIANDFSPQAMADAIKSLTREKIMHYKNQCHLNARLLSAGTNIQKIKETAEKLTAPGFETRKS
jgi:ribosomal protein L7Ae-like RNA K-turn-binding protein